MPYINRHILPKLQHTLARGKSILLLGARQTGKTTLIQQQLQPDISYNFADPNTRQRFEKNPSLLGQEIAAQIRQKTNDMPIVFIDEVQKIPAILDAIQILIDQQIAKFILTGSSARKLKYGTHVNLLPGRIVLHHLDPLLISEIPEPTPPLLKFLIYGSLPGIVTETVNEDKNIDLNSYAKTYVEEEIRAEAIVRNVGHFAKFLFLAATESGNLINFSQLSQAIGVANSTIAGYFQILEDCLLIHRIEPFIHSSTRKRMSKASKFLFFDLGVRRSCAEEGTQLPMNTLAQLFEQFVGLELIRATRFQEEPCKILHWRDHAGPEIDYIVSHNNHYIPIEVKWSDQPTEKDCRHIKLFLNEYENTKEGYIVCQTPRRFQITPQITAIPWQEIHSILR